MADEKLDNVLRTVDPAKRDFLRRMVVGTAFAVPVIASYSVKDLAQAAVGTPPLTTTTTTTPITTTTTTV